MARSDLEVHKQREFQIRDPNSFFEEAKKQPESS